MRSSFFSLGCREQRKCRHVEDGRLMPARPKSEDARTDDEIVKAIISLSTADLLKLEKVAYFRSAKLRGLGLGIDPQDLVNDAIERTLDGRRKWPRSISLMTHLCGCLRSLANHCADEFAGKHVSMTPLDAEEIPADIALRSQLPTGERIHHAREFLAEILRRFDGDDEVILVAEGLAKEMSGPEIQKDLGLTEQGFETILKRLRHGLDRKQGWRL